MMNTDVQSLIGREQGSSSDYRRSSWVEKVKKVMKIYRHYLGENSKDFWKRVSVICGSHEVIAHNSIVPLDCMIILLCQSSEL